MNLLTLVSLGILAQASGKPEVAFGWKLGVEHRFVWVQNGEKVGETLFQLDSAAPQAREGEGRVAAALYRISARRRYERAGISQRGKGTTTVHGDGTPVKFEESLEVGALENKKAHQETVLEFSNAKAHLSYVQGGKKQPPLDLEVPKGTFLTASQAIEHWAILLSSLPPGCEQHQLKVFYPDFGKLMDVIFRKSGAEKLKTGQGEVEATRYSFASEGNSLRGSVWTDASGRLLQMEFPNPSKDLSLRVTLAR